MKLLERITQFIISSLAAYILINNNKFIPPTPETYKRNGVFTLSWGSSSPNEDQIHIYFPIK